MIRCRRRGWTTKSLRCLAEELTRQGHAVSAPRVGKLLRDNGVSLQANAKTLEGQQHPDRDAQFRYLNEQVKDHQRAGEPVISVDTKQKQQLGRLPTPGREWRPRGEPVEVADHSFFSTGPAVAHAIPCDQEIQHHALLVHRPPQVVGLALDLDEHLVEVLLIPWAGQPTT